MKKLLLIAVALFGITACGGAGNPEGKTARELVQDGIRSGWPVTKAENCRRAGQVWYWGGLGTAKTEADLDAFYAEKGLTRGPRSIIDIMVKMFNGQNLSDPDKQDLSCIVTVVDAAS